MEECEYLTVGQLAREVGTTVRTIQYYDQQGLLSPSAKGPGNQRLYSPADVVELYRILTLKYLGLSLADIKEHKDSVDDTASFREVLMQTMASLEEDFQNLVKRLSVLRVLLDRTSDGSQVDWVGFVRTMENDDELGGLFWNRIARDALPAEADNRDAGEQHAHGLAVAKWHDLIADAISLMSDSVDPADMRTASLAERYRQLELDRAGSLDQMFILAENIVPHRGGSGSFNELRDNVARYLGEVVRAHGHGKDGDS